jgi:formylglycine-generating enzyme required for sulfatase activity
MGIQICQPNGTFNTCMCPSVQDAGGDVPGMDTSSDAGVDVSVDAPVEVLPMETSVPDAAGMDVVAEPDSGSAVDAVADVLPDSSAADALDARDTGPSEAGADVATDTTMVPDGASGDAGAIQRSCPDPMERGCGLVAIPGGTFAMGESGQPARATPVQPEITVGDFLMDSNLVTVARFRRFWNAGHPAPSSPIRYPGGTLTWSGPVNLPSVRPLYGGTCNFDPAGRDPALEQHPLNCVDWNTAQAFCVWDGGRLPTEAEWEYAARGRNVPGLPSPRSFPWGNTIPSAMPCDLAHFNACPGDDGKNTRRVGSFPASGGLFDMAGNVWQWTADSFMDYSDMRCWGGMIRSNPLCTVATGRYTIRGGWWGNPMDTLANNRILLYSATRGFDPPDVTYEGKGFRCVRNP